MVLVKSDRSAGNCWRSLLEDSYEADPWVLDQMEKKLTLERFQREVSCYRYMYDTGLVGLSLHKLVTQFYGMQYITLIYASHA